MWKVYSRTHTAGKKGVGGSEERRREGRKEGNAGAGSRRERERQGEAEQHDTQLHSWWQHQYQVSWLSESCPLKEILGGIQSSLVSLTEDPLHTGGGNSWPAYHGDLGHGALNSMALGLWVWSFRT